MTRFVISNFTGSLPVLKNSNYARHSHYKDSINVEKDSLDWFCSSFFLLSRFINCIVLSYEFIPLRYLITFINNSPVLLKQKDSSLHDTPSQEAGFEVLRSVNPVANWTKCWLHKFLRSIDRSSVSNPACNPTLKITCCNDCQECVFDEHTH